LASWIKLVHRSSAFAVYVSFFLLAEALWEALHGYTVFHAALMASTVLTVFVTGITTSYAASGARRSKRAEKIALVLVTTTYTVALTGLGLGGLILLDKLPPRLILVAIYAVYAIALWIVGAEAPRGSVGLSIAGLAYAYTLSAIYALASSPVRGFFTYYLGLVYALAVTSIYAVTIHSFPSTYGEKPRTPLVYVLYAAQGASLALYAWRPSLGALALALTMLLYIPAARIDKLLVFLEKTRAMKKGPARSSHLYFLIGHVFSTIYAVLVLASSLMYSRSPDIPKLLYIFIHMTTIGFVTQHILIHAPMMVPIILGIPTARRYTALNYILLFLAAVSFPMSSAASLVLLVLALLVTVLVAWPRGFLRSIPPSL